MNTKKPEARVKADVKKLLNAYGAHNFWPVQSGFGAPALDAIVCDRGRYASVETKAPGKKLTPRQELTRSDIEAAGRKVIVIGERLVDEPRAITVGTVTIKLIYSGMLELAEWLRLER